MRFAGLSALLHRGVTRKYLSRHDIGLPEWRVLTILKRLGPIQTRTLRGATGMDKAQVSRALLELERRGLVQRRADASHELRQVLVISKPGLELYGRIMPDARRSQAAMLDVLTQQERTALDSALRKLKAFAEAEAAEDAVPATTGRIKISKAKRAAKETA